MARALLFVLLVGTVACAEPQPKDPPAKDVPPGAKEPDVPTVEVHTFAATPAPAPTPAHKKEMLPRARDRAPGNAAIDYHRAAILRPSWPRDPKESAKLNETLNSWDELPVEKLPVAEVKKHLAGYSQTFRALDAAAKAERCDWELAQKISVNNLDLLLPEVQTYRELARFQRFRIRVDLAENDFDDAVRNIRTGIRMGKDVGEGATLIQSLVGIAVTAIFLNEVEQLIQRPNSPNLYWALTTLPRPLLDARSALEGEGRIFDNLFPNAKALEKGPVSADRANAMLEEMLTSFNSMGAEPGAIPGGFALAGYVALHAGPARKHLVELGWPAATVEKMPSAQVVALRAIAAYRTMSDDQAKCFALPYPDARAELTKVRARADKLKKETGDPIVGVFALTLPAVEKVHEAHARTDRRIAALRVIEAIRLHAAANAGKLPNALADIKAVPVPNDPYTDKPFEYAAKGDAFALTLPPPAGEKPNRSNHHRYEVTVRK
jgi:hypothetical protein